MDQKKLGIILILIASILWAFEPILAKFSYSSASFIQTTAVRTSIACLVGLVYAFITTKGNLKVTKHQFSIIICLALLASIISDLLYYYALTKLSVVNVTLLSHLQPLFIILIGYFILKEDKLTIYAYVGIFLMVIAGALVTTGNIINLINLKFGTFEDFLIIIAAIIWSITTILARKYLMKINPGIIIFYRFLIAGTFMWIYLFFANAIQAPSLVQITLGIIVGVGMILYYESLKRLKAAQTSSLELSSTVFAAVLGFFLLKEYVNSFQIGGIVLLCVGVYFISRNEHAIS